MNAPAAPRANVIGLGLIGGSIALALRDAGWHVSGDDIDPTRVDEAVARACVDAGGLDPDAAITFVAVPVLAVPDQVKRALAETAGVVTDVGGVKGSIAAAISDARFVGGHPMAGSELDGLDGADGSMFNGAVWVLTPVAVTDDVTFAHVAGVVAQLGAEVVAMAPERHGDHVVVSHVPHPRDASTFCRRSPSRPRSAAAVSHCSHSGGSGGPDGSGPGGSGSGTSARGVAVGPPRG